MYDTWLPSSGRFRYSAYVQLRKLFSAVHLLPALKHISSLTYLVQILIQLIILFTLIHWDLCLTLTVLYCDRLCVILIWRLLSCQDLVWSGLDLLTRVCPPLEYQSVDHLVSLYMFCKRLHFLKTRKIIKMCTLFLNGLIIDKISITTSLISCKSHKYWQQSQWQQFQYAYHLFCVFFSTFLFNGK